MRNTPWYCQNAGWTPDQHSKISEFAQTWDLVSAYVCAVPLLQFRSQRSEEVRLERQSKGITQMVIKTVNDEEGTNLRCWGREEFVPNRQEDARHNEKGIKVDRSQSKLVFELKYRRVIKGYLYEGENYRNTRRTRFPGSVLELQICQVVETLPWRNLRSNNTKGVNIGTQTTSQTAQCRPPRPINKNSLHNLTPYSLMVEW